MPKWTHWDNISILWLNILQCFKQLKGSKQTNSTMTTVYCLSSHITRYYKPLFVVNCLYVGTCTKPVVFKSRMYNRHIYSVADKSCFELNGRVYAL